MRESGNRNGQESLEVAMNSGQSSYRAVSPFSNPVVSPWCSSRLFGGGE